MARPFVKQRTLGTKAQHADPRSAGVTHFDLRIAHLPDFLKIEALRRSAPFDDADFAPEGRPASGYGRAAALPWREQIALIDAFAREWHGVEGRISVVVGPSGPQRCTDALLEVEIAGSNPVAQGRDRVA